MHTSQYNRRRWTRWAGATLLLGALVATASPTYAAERSTATDAERESRAMALLADTAASVQLWLRTGIVVPPQAIRSARQSSTTATSEAPEHNYGLVLDGQFRGYDWDSAGDGSSD